MVKVKISDEDSSAKFKRIAGNRANKILEQLRLLGNCSNKRHYEYNEKQVSEIFNIIEQEIKETKLLFKKNNKREIKL